MSGCALYFGRAGLVALALALAACAERSPSLGSMPRFQLVAVESAVTSVEPAAPVEPARRFGPATLIVGLQGALSRARRVMMTMADIEEVKVTVRFESDGTVVELHEVVGKAALAAGQTSVTFAHLPIGSVEVVIEAMDGQQQVIGLERRRVYLAETAPTRVDLVVPLARGTSSGGSGSGGVAPPAPAPAPAATGALEVGVALADGEAIANQAPGTRLGTFSGEQSMKMLQVAPSGDLWVVDRHADLVKLAPDGTRLAEVSLGYEDRIVVDTQGQVWRATGATLYRYRADGALVDSKAAPAKAIAVNAAGEVWTAGSHTVNRMDGTGQVLGTFTVPLSEMQRIIEIALDEGSGAVWVVAEGGDAWERYLIKLSASGQVEVERLIPRSSGRPAVDPSGQVWLPTMNESQVLRLSAGGSVVGRYDMPWLPHSVYADRDGRVWVCAGTTLFKLALDGTVLNEYRPGSTVYEAASAPDGSLWVSHGTFQGTLTQIAP